MWSFFRSLCSVVSGKIARATKSNKMDSSHRVASPRTKALQEEMARRITEEQQHYLDNANASETGSVMDRHMGDFMNELENQNIGNNQQRDPALFSITNIRGGGYIRHVNFLSRHGRIVQIEHVPLEINGIHDQNAQIDLPTKTNGILRHTAHIKQIQTEFNGIPDQNTPMEHVPTEGSGTHDHVAQIEHIPTEFNHAIPPPASNGARDCNPPAYASPGNNLMQLQARPASRGSGGSLPRHSGPRRSLVERDLRNQDSVASTLRRRSRVQDLAQEAGFRNSMLTESDEHHDGTDDLQATVEEEPGSPTLPPQVPEHAGLQLPPPTVNNINDPAPPPMINDLNHQEPPQYADIGNQAYDIPLPPHLDENDPVGADFLIGMTELRRAGDGVQTLGAGLGMPADDPQVQEIHARQHRAEMYFTTSSVRAARAAANQRDAHQMTNDALNRLRLAEAGLNRHVVAQSGNVEELQVQNNALRRQLEYAENRRAEDRLRMQHMANVVALETQARAHAEAALADAGHVNNGLARELEGLAANFYGY